MATGTWYHLKKSFALFPGRRDAVSADVLHDHYAALAAQRSILRVLLDSALGSLFLLWIGPRARQIRKRYGLDEQWRLRATRIARARFLDPNEIALMGFDSEAAMATVIRRFEFPALSKTFNPAGWRYDCVLADKRRFFERCRAAGLPQPAMVAMRIGGSLTVFEAGVRRELIAKPVGGTGGHGVRLIKLSPDERSGAGLSDCLRRFLPGRGDWLVQERVRNHPALIPLGMDALITVRITTMLNEQGDPEIVAALLRYPIRAGVYVDNTSHGGLMSAIDLTTGRLGAGMIGRSAGDLRIQHVQHPATGGQILDFVLPHWRAVRRLVLRAHGDAFSSYTMIGWDVAVTTGGPLLIEGNGKPNILTNQRAAGRGAGGDRTGELIRYHLARARSGELADWLAGFASDRGRDPRFHDLAGHLEGPLVVDIDARFRKRHDHKADPHAETAGQALPHSVER